jgi:hypothetical protein
MDCPTEEQMIRMKLEPFASIQSLQFDIPKRTLEIYHEGNIKAAEDALNSLNLNAVKKSTVETESSPDAENKVLEKNILITVLLINFGFFITEIIAGLIAGSMGLVGDSRRSYI